MLVLPHPRPRGPRSTFGPALPLRPAPSGAEPPLASGPVHGAHGAGAHGEPCAPRTGPVRSRPEPEALLLRRRPERKVCGVPRHRPGASAVWARPQGRSRGAHTPWPGVRVRRHEGPGPTAGSRGGSRATAESVSLSDKDIGRTPIHAADPARPRRLLCRLWQASSLSLSAKLGKI